MIHTYIPYAPKDKDFDLGWAYNNFMEMVNDDDWVLFLDHDATFTTKYWYHQVTDIVEANPEYGAFTAITNRIGNSSFQKLEGVDENNHDIKYHRKIGSHLQEQYQNEVMPYPTHRHLSGVIILVSKKTWEQIGGFTYGFLGVDNIFHKKCREHDIPVGIAKGLYVYHWYRGNGDTNHLDKSMSLHGNAYFRER